ncbi:MAG: hypothetical protein Q8L34_04390 [Candidatus Woesearchaeota archaeon]|nr:hypothetical protein [Candidatus Woesearchaeota archaeon]
MQVIMQTRLNPPTVVYDSQAPEGDGEATTLAKKVVRWLYPAIKVMQGNTELYKTREFYQDDSGKTFAIAVGVLTGAFIGSGLLIRAFTRR